MASPLNNPTYLGRRVDPSSKNTTTNTSSRNIHSMGETVDSATVTDQELLQTSLSDLSKKLSSDIPSRLQLSIYLRWLELHRQNETRLTEHWVNTLLHWAQSLRSRGFREDELIREVNMWKDRHEKENGAFRSKTNRYPPGTREISNAYREKSKAQHWNPREQDTRRIETYDDRDPAAKFLGKPPPNYICNRCGQTGT